MKKIRHIAFIMDGNGRWAKKQGKKRIFGHKKGSSKIKEVANWCMEESIEVMTIYAFSKENWTRPKEEVNYILSLIKKAYKDEFQKLHKQNVRIKHIGDKKRVPEDILALFDKIEKETFNNTGLVLLICFDYSSRFEIIQAVKQILQDFKDGKIDSEEINEKYFESHLLTNGYPDPDLMIRTSGEQRLSNFLMYQMAYTEFYFEQQFWPEYSKKNFKKAIDNYYNRDRRYGKI